MRIRTVLGLTLSALLLLPMSASGCVFQVSHGGNPFPPCEADDEAYRQRINQVNTQLVGKVTSVAQTILMVRKEVDQWRDSWRQAKNWINRYRETYSKLTASPLPSMIAAYNRNAPLGKYLKLSANGTWAVSLEPVDFREVAERFLAQLEDEVRMAELYFSGLPESLVQSTTNEASWIGHAMTDRVTDLANHERYAEQVSDSLQAKGEAFASRYTDWTDGGALSEARISRLSAALSRLRGTSALVESRALQARMQALETAVDRGQRLREREMETRLGAW